MTKSVTNPENSDNCHDSNQQKSLTIDSELTSAAENYRKARKDLNASLCEENLKLLKLQRELEDKLQVENKLLGKSVHDTCKSLLEMKEVKLAEKLKNDFKIPEKRWVVQEEAFNVKPIL